VLQQIHGTVNDVGQIDWKLQTWAQGKSVRYLGARCWRQWWI